MISVIEGKTWIVGISPQMALVRADRVIRTQKSGKTMTVPLYVIVRNPTSQRPSREWTILPMVTSKSA